MQQRKTLAAERARPLIEVMPHLSAPIDEHRIIPYPPRRWWEKAIIAGLVIGPAAAAMAYLFIRATALR